MQQRLQERASRAGFGHYEVSAYAQPGQTCVHNLNYWTFGDYWESVRRAQQADGGRRRRPPGALQPAGVLLERAGAGASSARDIGCRQRAAVRIHAERVAADRGVPGRAFGRRTGLRADAISPAVGRASSRMIEADPTRNPRDRRSDCAS